MRLYEYEGKELFKKMDIKVPQSFLLSKPEDIDLMGDFPFPLMVKAQVQAGGRGKAGLIKPAADMEELKARATEIFAKIQKHETILLEEQIKADSEAYIGITINDVEGIPYIVISRAGGMEIEQLAKSADNNIVKVPVIPGQEMPYYKIFALTKQAGFSGPLLPKVASIVYKLYCGFVNYELDLIEINPLLIVGNDAIAGDAKVITDEYVHGKYNDLQPYYDRRKELEQNDVKTMYVSLGGNIGIVSFGASNTMMVVDTIKFLGGEPANFSDVVGGTDFQTAYEMSKQIMENCVANPDTKAILINVTLVAHSLKVHLEAILKAYLEVKPKMPVVANARAAGAACKDMSLAEGAKLLEANGIIWCDTLEGAIDKVIKISQGRGE